jgi:hypothetical protein
VFLIRDIFRCKPRKAGALAKKFLAVPSTRPSLLQVLASWAPLDEDFPDVADLPPAEDVDL